MLPLDVPNVPPQYPAIVLAQTGQAQQQSHGEFDRTIGVCQLVSNGQIVEAWRLATKQGTFDRLVGVCQFVRNPPRLPGRPGRILASNSIGPGGAVVNYFRAIEGRTTAYSAEASL